MRFRFTRRAERDIEEIGDYIARDNPRRAVSFIRQLRLQCRKLAEFPEAHALRHELGRDVRVAVHGRYLIFYVAYPERVEIVRVLHGARNITDLDSI
jgi:toxin ParE1/3/4